MGEIIAFNNRGHRARLREAQLKGELIRLWRGKLEHGSFCGYVAAVGREFVLLWVVGDSIGYDGLYAMRHSDITELEAPDEHHRFVERSLALRAIKPALPDGFPLDDIKQVVRAAALAAPVIGVHVDSEDECEVCYIGRLLELEDDGFNLQEITPDAEWLTEPSFFAWDEVSTISFDEPYAQALCGVAGQSPAMAQGGPGVGRAH